VFIPDQKNYPWAMALIVAWFVGTLIVPLLIPIDKLFGFPVGSFTIISWLAVGVNAISSENFAFKRLAKNQKIENESDLSSIGKILLWTLVLAIGFLIVKNLF
jgi:hypothetical protein